MRRQIECTLIAALLGVLSACSETQTTRLATRERNAPVEALALPAPGGPAVVDISERRYANAIEQHISLTTQSSVAGQNFLRVQFFGPMGSDAGASRLSNPPLAEAGITREMRAAIAGIAMSRSPLYVQNSYGPFGYAVGRHESDLCLYAWQRLTNTTAHLVVNTGTIQIRLRICGRGATEASLLSVMYGLTVNAAMSGRSWNPYGDPRPADPRLGQTGIPILPTAPDRMEPVLEAPPPAARPREARKGGAVPASPPAAPELPAPPPGAPIVPPPPGAVGAVGTPIVPPPP